MIDSNANNNNSKDGPTTNNNNNMTTTKGREDSKNISADETTTAAAATAGGDGKGSEFLTDLSSAAMAVYVELERVSSSIGITPTVTSATDDVQQQLQLQQQQQQCDDDDHAVIERSVCSSDDGDCYLPDDDDDNNKTYQDDPTGHGEHMTGTARISVDDYNDDDQSLVLQNHRNNLVVGLRGTLTTATAQGTASADDSTLELYDDDDGDVDDDDDDMQSKKSADTFDLGASLLSKYAAVTASGAAVLVAAGSSMKNDTNGDGVNTHQYGRTLLSSEHEEITFSNESGCRGQNETGAFELLWNNGSMITPVVMTSSNPTSYLGGTDDEDNDDNRTEGDYMFQHPVYTTPIRSKDGKFVDDDPTEASTPPPKDDLIEVSSKERNEATEEASAATSNTAARSTMSMSYLSVPSLTRHLSNSLFGASSSSSSKGPDGTSGTTTTSIATSQKSGGSRRTPIEGMSMRLGLRTAKSSQHFQNSNSKKAFDEEVGDDLVQKDLDDDLESFSPTGQEDNVVSSTEEEQQEDKKFYQHVSTVLDAVASSLLRGPFRKSLEGCANSSSDDSPTDQETNEIIDIPSGDVDEESRFDDGTIESHKDLDEEDHPTSRARHWLWFMIIVGLIGIVIVVILAVIYAFSA